MKRYRPVLFVIAISCGFAPICSNTICSGLLAQAESGGIDLDLGVQYFAQADAIFKQDGGKLWGKSLAGAMIFAGPGTRQIVSNGPDSECELKKEGDVYVGTLPKKELISNRPPPNGPVSFGL